MKPREKQHRWDLVFAAVLTVNAVCLPFVASPWFTATMALLVAAWWLFLVQSLWFRGEVYRLGGTPCSEVRTSDERADAVARLIADAPRRRLPIPAPPEGKAQR